MFLLTWIWHVFSVLWLSKSMILVWKRVDVTDKTRHKDEPLEQLSDHTYNSDTQHATQDLVVVEVVFTLTAQTHQRSYTGPESSPGSRLLVLVKTLEKWSSFLLQIEPVFLLINSNNDHVDCFGDQVCRLQSSKNSHCCIIWPSGSIYTENRSGPSTEPCGTPVISPI